VSKARTQYQCDGCGQVLARWAGQCPGCEQWNTMVEQVYQSGAKGAKKGFAGAAGGGVVLASDVSVVAEATTPTGLVELDRVLGGGLVAGGVVLIGGDPGIGKSTLLLQAIAALVSVGVPGMYVTGEESLAQVVARGTRLGLDQGALQLLAQTEVGEIIAAAQREKPRVLVIDSIQTMQTDALTSAPGGVAQVRECAAELVRYAKATGTVLLLVGHVTKEGALAGPRVLEHMVDTVLYFESESSSRFRLVRAVKNRFGAVNEMGIFAMTEQGLRGVTNPSAIFLSRGASDAPGSVVTVTREGTRPLLVEVQALVDQSNLGTPRRVAVGTDGNRLSMLLAILHRHGGLAAHDQDVFVNVVGGVRLTETAADLAVIAAVVSSLRDRALPSGTVVLGELGLAGEVRPVPYGEERLRECAKHGFTRAFAPKVNIPKRAIDGLEVVPIERLSDLLDVL
jgi:DNA repair protein RadA/Sms